MGVNKQSKLFYDPRRVAAGRQPSRCTTHVFRITRRMHVPETKTMLQPFISNACSALDN